MKYVAYLRISSHSQKEKGDSIDGQRLCIKEWARANNHQIVKWYIEESRSAYKGTRKKFNVMLQDLKEHSIDAHGVVVYSLNRLARKSVIQQTFLDFMEDQNYEIESIIESLPKDRNSSRLIASILGIINEHQSRENARVVSDRLDATARKGFHTGGPRLFGYHSITVPGDTSKERKKLVVINEEAEIVREIYELSDHGLYGKGMGVKEIAKILNNRNISYKGNKWNRNSVNRVLRNSAYIGKFVFGKQKKWNVEQAPIVIPVPTIVDKELFDSVQKKLTSRQIVYNNAKSIRSNSLLTGVLLCPKCRSKMVIITGKSGRYKYYKCSKQTRLDPNLCSGKAISKGKADSLVRSALVDEIFNEEHLVHIYEEVKAIGKKKKRLFTDKIKPLKFQISSLNNRAKNLIDLLSEGKIEANALVNNNLKEYEEKIYHLEKKVEQYKNVSAVNIRSIGLNQLNNFSTKVRDYIMNSDDEVVKPLILAVVKEITIEQEKKNDN